MWPAPGISIDSITDVTGLGRGRSARKKPPSLTLIGGGPTVARSLDATRAVSGLRPG
jgi:hypothetical protein